MIFALETHRLLFPTGITVALLKEAVGLLILYSERPFFQEAFVWIFDSSEFRRIGRDFGEYSIERGVSHPVTRVTFRKILESSGKVGSTT